MGSTKGPYNPEFVRRSTVKIRDAAFLESFRKSWSYHHPLQPEQLAFAGREAEVATASVYHGGDELYTLVGVPGIWHESCLGPS
jgi:hypothetical protein